MLQANQDLPSLLAELPNAYALLVQWHGQQAMKSSASSSTGPEPPIPVQGNAFINSFCGETAFALGMVFQQVSRVEPWEFAVLRRSEPGMDSGRANASGGDNCRPSGYSLPVPHMVL